MSKKPLKDGGTRVWMEIDGEVIELEALKLVFQDTSIFTGDGTYTHTLRPRRGAPQPGEALVN